jgi:hypothetical protein
LEEVNPSHKPYSSETDKPTEAAKALVGKYVPLKLVADLCDDAKQETAEGGHSSLAHLEVLKEFEAYIIEPLTVTEVETQDFTDATTSGSTIEVTGAFTYTSWNADENGKNYPVSKYGSDEHAKALWNFYEAVEATWRTDLIKTNLKQDANGNLVPTAGVKDGKLPSTTTVVFKREGDKETLTYNNYSGTPVNQEYIMYIPVEFGYKWKTFTKTFEVKVKVNAGTPNV